MALHSEIEGYTTLLLYFLLEFFSTGDLRGERRTFKLPMVIVDHQACSLLQSHVYHSMEFSLPFFQIFRWVRQGDLSPILFAIFLNGLESFMANNGATCINLDLRYDQLTIFLKIFVLLYADDIVIFGIEENQF